MASVTTQQTFQPVATTTFGTTSPVTGAAPSDAGDGLATAQLSQVTVYMTAPSGQTFSGAGTLQAWEFSPVLSRWARVPAADITIATSGVRDIEAGVCLVAQFVTPAPQKTSTRVQYVPSAVTFSGGSSGVLVTLVGTKAIIASTGVGV